MFIKNNTLIKRLLLICFLMAWAICLKNNSIFKSIEKTDDTSGFTITYRKAKPKKPISDIKSEEVKGLITKISEELPTTQPKTQILSERKNNDSLIQSIEKTDDTSEFTIKYRKAKPKKPISNIKSEEVKEPITKISEGLSTTGSKIAISSERKNNDSLLQSIKNIDDTSEFTITYRKAKPKEQISNIKSEEVKEPITKISEELPTTQPKTQILSERKNFKKIEDNQIILGKNVAECQTSNKKITEIEKLEEELNFVQALSHAVEDLQSMETLLYERLWNTDETQDKTQDQTKQFYKNLEVERELIAEIEGNFEESYSTMTTQVKEENLKKIEKIINLLMENNEKIKKSSNNIKTIILKQIEDMNYFINELEIIQIIIITS